MSTLRIRLAGGDDAATVTDLFHATDAHYWGAAAPSYAATAAHVRDHVLAPGSGCEIALAERDGVGLGYATFAVLYPAPDLGGALFMKDLFVTGEARSSGIGEAMIRFLAAEALRRGCVRFDWSAETENQGALRLYDRLGAQRVPNKVYYRLQADALHRLCAGAPGDGGPDGGIHAGG
ncbi:MAG: GNAT family N-acetyltransferase [Alphaproteobacteria bacterium]